MTSEVTADGRFHLAVNFNADNTRGLSKDEALAYGHTVLAICHRAEYDSAVMRQMTTEANMSTEEAAQLVADMRSTRPPADNAAIAPLGLEAVVVQSTLKPALLVFVGGRQVGQWAIADARAHAFHVLDGVESVALDEAFFRHLVTKVGIEETRALGVVQHLACYREHDGEPTGN